MKPSFVFVSSFIGIGVLFSCLAIIFAVAFYLHSTGGPLSSLERTIHNQLRVAISRGERSIKLKTSFTSFPWDRLCFLYPYESKISVEEQLGVKLGFFDWPLWWNENDGFWTLVFVASGSIIPVRVPVLTMAEPPSETNVHCVERESGYLDITQASQGGYKFDLR